MIQDKYIKIKQPFYFDTYLSHFKCLVCGYASENWQSETKYFNPEQVEEEIQTHIKLAHKTHGLKI